MRLHDYLKELAAYKASYFDLSLIQQEAFINRLSPRSLLEFKYNIDFWLRPEQIVDGDDWDVFLIKAGRGFGKTMAGAAWMKKQLLNHRPINGRDDVYAMVGPTYKDLTQVMIPMLQNMFPKDEEPILNKGTAELRYKNGATIYCYSSETEIRGPNIAKVWCDELAKWFHADEQYDTMSYAVRIGRPQILVTTTPIKNIKIIKELMIQSATSEKVRLVEGSSFDNKFLPKTYRNTLEQKRGTRKFRQEALGELLSDEEDAMFHEDNIALNRFAADINPEVLLRKVNLPLDRQLSRIVVSIDPAGSANPESDMTGIIVVGCDMQGHGYVLEDASIKSGPKKWAETAIALYKKYQANYIVAEKNFGGDMVENTIHSVDPHVPVKLVTASRGKLLRAEPIAAKYAQNLIHHVGSPKRFEYLEDQMTQFTGLPSTSKRKDDRLDALIWGLNELLISVSVAYRSFNLPNFS